MSLDMQVRRLEKILAPPPAPPPPRPFRGDPTAMIDKAAFDAAIAGLRRAGVIPPETPAEHENTRTVEKEGGGGVKAR